MKFNQAARALALAALTTAAIPAAPAMAQDEQDTFGSPGDVEIEDTVFDDTWISIGVGVGYGPSYDGSDDYRIFPVPLLQGQIGPVGIIPRSSGVALDFIPSSGNGAPDFNLGVVATLNRSRSNLDEIDDPVVELAGELDTAIEVGPTAGITLPGLLNQFDSLSLAVDAKWDVAGAHDGLVVAPIITYFTPFSRGIAASFQLSAEYGDDDHNAYYYSVTGGQALASGLPLFNADSGFTKVSSNLLLGIDLDGDLANGGLAAVVIGGYTRLVGDAKDTPYTSLRGNADQFLGAVGIGYTF